MNQPASSTSGNTGSASQKNGGGLPINAGLRIVMGVGFLAVGLVQGVGILRAEELAGAEAVIDGIGFFLLAGTGVTMLMDRFYSLFLLLVWAVLGVLGVIFGEGGATIAGLFARVMVALVALVAIGQRGSLARSQAAGR